MESNNNQKGGFRRSSIEIIDLIYEALPVESHDPIAHIAERAGLDWSTTKRHLDLMLHIQEKQKGNWLDVRDFGDKKGYARKRR